MLSAALAQQGTVPNGISIPTDPQWHNFVDAWNVANITTLVKSSVMLVAGVVPASLLFAAMAGLRVGTAARFPSAHRCSSCCSSGLTLPFETVIVPLYYQIQGMGLLNTQLGLHPADDRAEHAVRGVLDANPLPEHPQGHLRIGRHRRRRAVAGNFRYIQIPLAVPALASLAVLMFLGTWNQFMLAIVLIQDPDKRTMAGALQAFVGRTPPTSCCSMPARC